MAGSYNHCVSNKGNFLDGKDDRYPLLDNLGDSFEAIEEMFGMIWYLAGEMLEMTPKTPEERAVMVKEAVETARQNYKEGLRISKEIHKLSPDKRRF